MSIPVKERPHWIRRFEFRRLVRGISGAELGARLGFSDAWWGGILMRATSPTGWNKILPKVERTLPPLSADELMEIDQIGGLEGYGNE